jgi:phosphatidylglycerol---prolipoprotein diacylglyceryl transferase
VHRVLLDVPALGLVLPAEQTFLRVGVLLTVCLCVRWARRYAGVERGTALRIVGALVLVVLAGGRLHYLLNRPDAFHGSWLDAIWLFGGPFHLPGGLIAVVLATPWLCRRHGIPAARFGDAITPAIGVGIAVVRLGCFLESCCYGTPCNHAWCLAFPVGSLPFEAHQRAGILTADATGSLPIHPLQLYFLAAGVLIALVGLARQRSKRFDGEVVLAGLLLYSATSAAFELVRADTPDRIYWGPLPQLEWTSLALCAATLCWLVVAEARWARGPARRRGVPLPVSD